MLPPDDIVFVLTGMPIDCTRRGGGAGGRRRRWCRRGPYRAWIARSPVRILRAGHPPQLLFNALKHLLLDLFLKSQLAGDVGGVGVGAIAERGMLGGGEV